MLQANPLVSIGIPTYNRPESLDEVLWSVRCQTYKNLEIVISDNCSSDPRVQEVIKRHRDADRRICAYRQTENIGLAKNTLFVLAKSTADYYHQQSDDDLIGPKFIEVCMTLLMSGGPSAKIAFTNFREKRGSDDRKNFDRYISKISNPHLFTRLLMFLKCPDNLGKALINFGVIRKHAYYDIGIDHIAELTYPFAEDYQILFRLLTIGNVLFDTETHFFYDASSEKLYIESSGVREKNVFDYLFFHECGYKVVDVIGLRLNYLRTLSQIENMGNLQRVSLKVYILFDLLRYILRFYRPRLLITMSKLKSHINAAKTD